MTNDGIALRGVGAIISASRRLRSVVLNRQNTLFDVRCWTFDAYSPPPVGSMFISFFSVIRLAAFQAGGRADT